MLVKLCYAAKPDCAGKTLVFLGIVILQSNLELNRFCELPFLLCGPLHYSGNCLLQVFSADFTVIEK